MSRPLQVTFDLSTLKVVSESRETWATCVPILVFLGLDLGPMYTIDVRQTSDIRRQTSDAHHRLMPPPYGGGGIIIKGHVLEHVVPFLSCSYAYA